MLTGNDGKTFSKWVGVIDSSLESDFAMSGK